MVRCANCNKVLFIDQNRTKSKEIFCTQCYNSYVAKKCFKKNDDGSFKVTCPQCFSNNIEIGKQGFSAGKAIVGGLFLGMIGLAAGIHNKGGTIFRCISCGLRWSPTEWYYYAKKGTV